MRIGILGCGRIAQTMARTVNAIDGFELYAVSSRSKEKAEELGREFGAAVSYGSYEEMVKDENVDLVYVATPHSHHKEHMLLAIENGRNVLCEKAFTVNEEEAETVFRRALEKGVYVAEAIWTRYMPSRRTIDGLIEDGRIGKVSSICANLCYSIMDKERIADPRLAGGALLDIGVYPLNFALMARNGLSLEKMSGVCTKSESGVDTRDSISLVFEDGSVASVFADATVRSDRRGIIYGTEGYIEVDNVNNPLLIRVYRTEGKTNVLDETIEIKEDFSGYEYELYEARKCIEEGRLEPYSMPHRETLRVMRIMDGFRKAWGIKLGSEIE